MFKPDPKKQVVLKFCELFGRELRPEVTGSRVNGDYHAEISLDGTTLAKACHSDWRRAYKMLKLEVEKLHVETTNV